MTSKKLLIIVSSAVLFGAAIFPYKSLVVPAWRVQVRDVNGIPCKNMPVMETWGHYSLFLTGNTDSEDAYTDKDGFVEFPERHIRASGIRRIVMPVITKALTIAHGSYGVHASVHINGLKEVSWLSYKGEPPLPDTAIVKRCLTDGDLRPKDLQ